MLPPNHLPSSTTAHKLAGLTHLRALAIILVFLFHYRLFSHPAWTDSVGSFGWTGVDLFFVLSGFLISRQLFRSIAQTGGFSIGEFYFKRVMRILPAYFVVLALYFCFPWFREKESLPPLWKFLLFTQNIGLNPQEQGTFSHAWSLCIEEQFYWLLPLVLAGMLAMKAGKKAFYLLPLLFAAGFIVRAFCWVKLVHPLENTDGFGLAWYRWIYYPTWSRLDGLLAGIALAALFQFRPALRDRITRYGNWWIGVTALVLALTYMVLGSEPTFGGTVAGFPLVDISFAFLVLAALSPSSVLYRLQSRASNWIATLSYSIYLVHKGCIHITQVQLGRLGLATNGTLMFVFCIITTAAGALLLHLLVEKPFMAWRDARLQNSSATLPSTG
jgi:peptidoglycan/LPS O-acetylase OafA/YrhL